MQVRLFATLLVGALAFMLGVFPCAAAMAAQAGDSTGSCGHADPPLPEASTCCDVHCAVGPRQVAAKYQSAIHPVGTDLLVSDRSPHASAEPFPGPVEREAPTAAGHCPPLFVLHSALLI